jgi:putative membrane protein
MPRALFASVFLAAVTAAGAAIAAPDAAFVKKALQGDNSEMRLGELAAAKGASPGVRDFGRMLSRDHAQAREQVLPLAQRLGIRATDAMAPEARAEERKLNRLSGRAFDREFARYMVQDHRKDIDEFQRQARTGGGQTRRLAEQTLPTLRHHLDVARGLAG